MGTTTSVRWTCCHSCAGRPLETEPSRAKTAITIIVVPVIWSPSASAVETPVVLTFWHKRGERTSVASNVSLSYPRQSWILDSTPWIKESRHWIPVFVSGTLDSGFKSLEGFWIPKPRIPDSTSNFPDSGFHQQKFLGFRNPHSLTWSELEVKEGNFSCFNFPNHILTVDQQKHRKKTLLPISSIC